MGASESIAVEPVVAEPPIEPPSPLPPPNLLALPPDAIRLIASNSTLVDALAGSAACAFQLGRLVAALDDLFGPLLAERVANIGDPRRLHSGEENEAIDFINLLPASNGLQEITMAAAAKAAACFDSTSASYVICARRREFTSPSRAVASAARACRARAMSSASGALSFRKSSRRGVAWTRAHAKRCRPRSPTPCRLICAAAAAVAPTRMVVGRDSTCCLTPHATVARARRCCERPTTTRHRARASSYRRLVEGASAHLLTDRGAIGALTLEGAAAFYSASAMDRRIPTRIQTLYAQSARRASMINTRSRLPR